jgi:nitrogen fixation NifU-like protein
MITDAVFRTFGCGSAIASSSVITEWVKGKHITEVYKIRNSDIAKFLSLPPVKLHCRFVWPLHHCLFINALLTFD